MSMTDDLEFRNDAELIVSAAGVSVTLCPNKFDALMQCAQFVRKQSVVGHGEAANLAVLLDRLDLTPDFKPYRSAA